MRPVDVEIADVWREGEQVGTITRSRFGSIFEYADAFFNHRDQPYAGMTYPSFPAGAHSRKREIEIGHIRRMIRHLGLRTCAEQHFPNLL